MNVPRRFEAALLAICIGIAAIALVLPIAGEMMDRDSMMGEGGMMGQGRTAGSMMGSCPENMTCMMMQSMVGGCPGNMTCIMMETMRDSCPDNMSCMMVQPMADCPQNMTCMMMQPMMGTCPANENCMMMRPMTGECPTNRTCYIVEQVRNASPAQTMLDCARFWLGKAMELHDLHLRDPTTTTNESQIELMNQITKAYECVSGKNVTSYLAKETGALIEQTSAVDEHGH
jgi:hypothetical protein